MQKNLSQWLTWMESIHPSEIDLGLARISEVAARLGLLQPESKVITVAGTNGKGSVIATLERLFVDFDQRVGVFTSPHLIRYNERVKLNGKQVDDSLLCKAFEAIDRAREGVTLTYFEFGALAAMLIFKQAQVDYWILEVGLGGRLDAVNIIDPDIAVITSIALDHMDWLGETRDQIAKEKAGILRKNIPVICADRTPPSSLVACFEKNVNSVFQIGRDFEIQLHADHCDLSLQLDTVRSSFSTLPFPKLPEDSVVAALQVAGMLGFKLDKEYLAKHLKTNQLAGRFEERERVGRQYVLDVAHNPAACEKLANLLTVKGYTRCHAIVAMMKDKQHDESLKPLIPCIDGWHLAELPDNSRAESANNIKETLMSLGVSSDSIYCYTSVEEADKGVQLIAPNNDSVVVFGSFFTLSAIYPLWRD